METAMSDKGSLDAKRQHATDYFKAFATKDRTDYGSFVLAALSSKRTAAVGPWR